MSNISTYLKQILAARYGKDVRQSIHDAIQEIDSVADTAQDSASNMAKIATEKASAAGTSATNAATSANRSASSASLAQSYARGRTGTRTGEDTDNAKYYAHQAMEATQVISTMQSGISPLTGSADGNVCGLHLVGKSYKSKNLLKPTLQTTTLNGITCTDNGDGTYTVDGTASSQVLLWVGEIPSDKDVRICGCPKKGRRDTYSLYVEKTYQNDVGDGINVSAYGMVRRAGILIQNGVKVNSLLFKPMLVDAGLYPNATYDDYEPYGIIKPSGDIKTHNSDSTKTSIVHTDHPLLSVGDIKNELIINPDGSGTFIEKVGKTDESNPSITYNSQYLLFNYKVKNSVNNVEVLNTEGYKNVGGWTDCKNTDMSCTLQNGGIYVHDERYTSVDSFKTGKEFIYQLATPTTTELSASEVADLLSLQTFQGGTYFDADGAEFTVTYFADTNAGQAMADVNTKFHTFYDELRTAIVALNGIE